MPPIQSSDLGTTLPDHARRSLDESLEICFSNYTREIVDYSCESAANAFYNLPASLKGSCGPDYSDEYIAASYLLHYQYNHCVMAYRTWKAVFDRISRMPSRLFVADVGSGADASYVGLAIYLHLSGRQTDVNFVSIEPSMSMRRAGFMMRDSIRLPRGSRIRHRNDTKVECRPSENLRFVTAFHLSLPYSLYMESKALQKLGHVLHAVSPHWFMATCHWAKTDTLKRGLPIPISAGVQFPNSREDPPACRVFSELGPQNGFDCDRERGPNCNFRGWNRLNPPKGAVFLDARWP